MENCEKTARYEKEIVQPFNENKNGKIIIISGPSGSGKGSIIHLLTTIYDHYAVAVSATSRNRRPGETNNKNYIFMSDEEFEYGILNGKFLEYSSFHGIYYGTLRETVESIIFSGTNAILDIDLSLAYQVKKQIPEAILVWINAINVDQLVEVLSRRDLNENEKLSRLAVYERELYDGLKADILLVNEETQDTVKKLDSFIRNLDLAKAEYEENVENTVVLKKEIAQYIKRRQKSFPLLGKDKIETTNNQHQEYNDINSRETTFVPNIQGDTKIYMQQLLKLEQMIQELTATVNDTNSKVTKLEKFVESDLQKWLQEEKGQFIYSVPDDESIAFFLERANTYINQQFISSNSLIEQENAKLKHLFGSVWERLLPATRTSLTSASVLWESCKGITDPDFDWSGICISATSALEGELRRWFFLGYQNYLLTFGELSTLSTESIQALWPEELLDVINGEYRLRKPDKFTMGMLPILFYKREENKSGSDNLEKMKRYLRTIVKERYRNNPTNKMNDPHNEFSFVKQCEKVRTTYRNPAAHPEVIPKDIAEDCYLHVVGKTEAHIHNAKIQGLIMMLYDFLE